MEQASYTTIYEETSTQPRTEDHGIIMSIIWWVIILVAIILLFF